MAASAAAGDLWVNCEPGSEIFLDGESVGVCESAGADLRIPGIEAGEHTMRVEANGVLPAEFTLSLGPTSAQVVIPELASMVEGDLPASDEGLESAPLAGTVEFTSNPRNCEVRFAGRTIDKKQPIVVFLGIPAGEYDLHAASADNVLKSAVTVPAGQSVKAMADFSSQRVAVSAVESVGGELESTTEDEVPREEPECIEYWIQVLRTSDPEAIQPVRDGLKEMGFPEYHQKLITVEDEGTLPLYKLRVGPITRHNQAKHFAGLIRHRGFTTAWVVPDKCRSSSQLKR